MKSTPSKELKLVLAGSTVNEAKESMFVKTKSPIEFTPLGILMVVSDVEPLNA